MGCQTSTPILLKKEAIVLDESIHGNSDHGDISVANNGEIVLEQQRIDNKDLAESNVSNSSESILKKELGRHQ